MRRTAELGLMLALALILSYVESLIPFSFGIPGIKLGLPNLIVLLLLYEKPNTGGEREALLVNVLRIVLSGFLFSSLYTILYALAGAAFSFAAMALGRRTKRFSMIGVSVFGGVFHNVGQLLAAMLVLETGSLIYYGPILLLAGLLTGFLIGVIAGEVWKRVHIR